MVFSDSASQVANGIDFQIWRMAVNILNKQSDYLHHDHSIDNSVVWQTMPAGTPSTPLGKHTNV